jgi:LysR family pca operon transcriptional activator
MLLATDMITVMPRMVMGADVLRGQVRVIPVAAPPMPRPAGIITNPARETGPGAQVLIRILRETLAELATAGEFDITR